MRSWMLVVMVGALGLGILRVQGQEPLNWHTVDVTTAVGNSVGELCLQIDADGNQHMAWFNAKDGHLVYAVKVDGSYKIETVDADGQVGMNASLRLDAKGLPHISYTDGWGRLKHAWRPEGAWQVEVVYQGKNLSLGTSLQIGKYGGVFISFYDKSSHDLLLAEWSAGEWMVTRIAPEAGGWPQLAFDAAGQPVILYEGGNYIHSTPAEVTGDGAPEGSPFVHLARRGADGAWAVQRLPVGNPRPRMKLLRDGEGHLAIIAGLQTIRGTCLLREVEGGWAYEPISLPVEEDTSAGGAESACFASDGSLIVYYENAAGKPEIARRHEGVWTRFPMARQDGKPIRTYSTAMAFSKEDWFTVAYFDQGISITNLVGVGLSDMAK